MKKETIETIRKNHPKVTIYVDGQDYGQYTGTIGTVTEVVELENDRYMAWINRDSITTIIVEKEQPF